MGDSYLTGDSIDHAVLWTQGGSGVQITDIGALASGDVSQATGINDLGAIVGFSNLLGGGTDTHAFLFQNSQLIDLNTLISASSGWTLEFASAISDTGQIAGYGLFGGVQRGFLLTPAPEPSALAVFVLGAAALGVLVARRRLSSI